MSQSSTLFAKLVHEAMRRIEHSYVRRKDGSKGGGAHTHVVQYAIEAEVTAPSLIWEVPDISYLSTGDDQGAFLIRRTGLYAVTMVVTRSSASATAAEIRVGAVVDNAGEDANTRAWVEPVTSENLATTLHWCGHVAAGWHIWTRNIGVPTGADDLNQISIARVG